eukprot:scaffold246504_cov30-Tisochrysis_lutea.AAC.4
MESSPPSVTSESEMCSIPNGPRLAVMAGKLKDSLPVLCVMRSTNASTPRGTADSTLFKRRRASDSRQSMMSPPSGGGGGGGDTGGGSTGHAAPAVKLSKLPCKASLAASRKGSATTRARARGST